MNKVFSVLALVVCGFWGASQAMAASVSICDNIPGNIVSNCGFEIGDFTDWSIGGITSNPGGVDYGVDGIDANSGNDGAYMSQDFTDDGVGSVILSQTLATTVGVTYDISYYLEQDSTPNVGYIHSFSSDFGSTVMQTLTPTPALPGSVGPFTEYSFEETATAASTTLTFNFENDDNYWSFDDVSVVAPEPSTGFLGGIALGAALLFWSRRRRSAGI